MPHLATKTTNCRRESFEGPCCRAWILVRYALSAPRAVSSGAVNQTGCVYPFAAVSGIHLLHTPSFVKAPENAHHSIASMNTLQRDTQHVSGVLHLLISGPESIAKAASVGILTPQSQYSYRWRPDQGTPSTQAMIRHVTGRVSLTHRNMNRN